VKAFWQLYSDLFSLSELKSSNRLKVLFFGVLSLSIFDLSRVSFTSLSVYGNDTCWAYFQNCTALIPLQHLPESYFYTGLMSFILLLHVLSGISAYHRQWDKAHLALLLIITWKTVFHFLLRDTGKQNFEYFMIIPAWVFLLSKNKLESTKLAWATLYFLAASVKIHESWIAGTYFTSMKLGLPLVPRQFEPLVSQLAILFEIFFSFGLLSKSKYYRKASFYLWIAFHLYSVFLVGYFYPVRCLVYLFILFYPLHSSNSGQAFKIVKQPMLALFLCSLIVLHAFFFLNKRDSKFTFEGLGTGFFMFDSNHQCFIQVKFFDRQETLLSKETNSLIEPRTRCSPWHVLQKIRKRCEMPNVSRAEYLHYHSLNGGPIYQMVHEVNACELEYSFLGANPWIKDQDKKLEILGYPYPNQIGMRNLSGKWHYSPTPQIQRTNYQNWIISHLEIFKLILSLLWILVVINQIRLLFSDQ